MILSTAIRKHKQPVVQDYDPALAAWPERKPRQSLLPPDVAFLPQTSARQGPAGAACSDMVLAHARGLKPQTRWRLLAASALLMLTIFFGTGLGLPSRSRIGLRPPFSAHIRVPDATAPPPDTKHRRIPRILHQTYKVAEPPFEAIEYMQSWRDVNEGYDFRFYDDEACVEFVKREFPEYYKAYVGLPKDVERSDFFRYMVLLRYGGVYADIDTEARQPVDAILKQEDTLVVGWENEWPTQASAFDHHYVRRRQVLQWVIMAAPDHPVLRDVCDFIAKNAFNTFSNNTNRDTLERTGPGIWTDFVLRHAVLSPTPAWPVRILPRVAFGVNPKDAEDAVHPQHSDIAVLHHFMGTWKVRGGWKKKPSFTSIINSLWMRRMVAADPKTEEFVKDSGTLQFPVSALFDPPFTSYVNLVGQGSNLGNQDISSEITIWGSYQAGMAPTRTPRVVDALAGALQGSPRAASGALIDIGAGLGYFSLSAAARGHQVHAFELSPANLDLLRRSAEANGFQNLIKVNEVALGDAEDTICVAREDVSEPLQVHYLSTGYASAVAHTFADEAECVTTAKRSSLTHLLSPEQADNIGAVRISAAGWEGWILDGMATIMGRKPPPAILLEFHPSAVPSTGYPHSAARILHQLFSWGYNEISHAGSVCDERWQNITNSILARSHYLWGTEEAAGLQQSTWCKLNPNNFDVLVQRAHEVLPETILFIHQGSGVDAQASGSEDGEEDDNESRRTASSPPDHAVNGTAASSSRNYTAVMSEGAGEQVQGSSVETASRESRGDGGQVSNPGAGTISPHGNAHSVA